MITLVGLGVLNLDHLTREADAVLRSAEQILYVDQGLATQAYLASCCSQVRSLDAARQEGVNADRELAAQVVAVALDHGPLVLALSGHPLMGNPVAGYLRQLCEPLGIELRVVAGISALDSLIAALGVDPLARGMQCFDATDIVLRQRVISADVPLWVFGLGSLGSRLHSSRPSRPSRFVPLRDHLLNFYLPTQPVVAAHAAPHPLVATTAQRFALADLCAYGPSLHPQITLLLPVEPPPVTDAAWAAGLESPAQLAALTTPETTEEATNGNPTAAPPR